jgi:hypothetical protein
MSPAQLLHGALELGVVERHDVERAHLVPSASSRRAEVQAEEARAAGDGPEH